MMPNNMSNLQSLLLLLGRVCLSFIFVAAGFDKIMHYQDTMNYMSSVGMPASHVLMLGAIIIEIGAGLMILLGFKARLGALILFIFVVITMVFFHDFWNVTDAEQATNQMYHFLKNLTILGGFLYVMVGGSGKFSLDNFCCCSCGTKKSKK